MKSLRLKSCILATTVLCASALSTTAFAQTNRTTATSVAPRAGQLTEQSLGNLLLAMGLKPKKEQKRYDFRFKAILNKQEWELSMSAVLSTDGRSIWVMAWLDELPKSAADVPRTALLRLLADNDRLGGGKFFAYIASNRRFVLQRVVPNENMSTAVFRDILKDLGTTVVVTYPHWSVANWKSGGSSAPANTVPTNRGVPASTATQTSPAPTRTTVNDSRFAPVRRN